MNLAKIAVASATYAIDRPYDYLVPEELADRIQPGMRVLVSFGAGNRRTDGIVLALGSQEPDGEKRKTILALLDDAPMLEPELLKLALWMREQYFCTVYDAARAMLPSGLWFSLKDCWKDVYKRQGLYGPQGTGLLLCGEGQMPMPLLQGGTGSVSALQEMPDFLPDRLEAGTQNVAGAAGLAAGMQFVQQTGLARIAAHERRLNRRLMDGLQRIPGVEVFQGDSGCQSGLCSFRTQQMDCEVLGEQLARRGIAMRSGLHCAPLAHQSAGTQDSGTVRASFSVFNRAEEVDRTLAALREILR